MKKLAKWLFVGGCLLSVLGVILSLGDEALSPQVRRAIEAVNQTPEPHENGYFAVLTGIDVAAEEDPWEVGYQFAERYERALASFSQPPKDYPKSRRLPLPEDLSSLCKVESEPCLVPFVEASDTIRTYQAEHAVLLDRYRDLYDYPHFVTTNTLSLNLPCHSTWDC